MRLTPRRLAKLMRRLEMLRADEGEILAQLDAVGEEASYFAIQGVVADDGNVAAEGRIWKRQLGTLARRLNEVRAEIAGVESDLALAKPVSEPGDALLD